MTALRRGLGAEREERAEEERLARMSGWAEPRTHVDCVVRAALIMVAANVLQYECKMWFDGGGRGRGSVVKFVVLNPRNRSRSPDVVVFLSGGRLDVWSSRLPGRVGHNPAATRAVVWTGAPCGGYSNREGVVQQRTTGSIDLEDPAPPKKTHMSLVKAKDIPHEQQLLEKRLSFVTELANVLANNRDSLVAQTVSLYTDLIEDILYDVCLDVHRDVVMRVERVGAKEGHQGDHETTETETETETPGKRRRGGSGRGRGRGRGQKTTEGRRGSARKRGREEGGAEEDEASPIPSPRPSATEIPSMEEIVKQAALHYGSASMLGVQMRGSKGAVDMFGNEIEPVAKDVVACMNCGRRVAAGRFASHLDKCLNGKQRR